MCSDPPHPNEHVLVRIAYGETECRRQAKQAAGTGLAELWQLPRRKAVDLGLVERIEGPWREEE